MARIDGLEIFYDWGFETGSIYLVLKSDKETYVFDTMSEKRPDVTKKEGSSGQNLDDSGFYAMIPTNKIKSGKYNIGIYIKKPQTEALQYTNEMVSIRR